MIITTRLSRFIFFVALLGAFAGCGSYVTEYRKTGFDYAQRGFAAIEESGELYEVIELKNVKIYIVGDRKDFNYKKAAAYGSPIAGYANTNNEIGLLGKRVGGKIVINQSILGHELNHLLNFKNPEIVNPDKLDEMGL
ncbi:MAG TPA: hypothetical protein VKA69_13145 [Desulfobacteria bacterium]|nr:hypothetical protein [Desulfobacteria bacterium]